MVKVEDSLEKCRLKWQAALGKSKCKDIRPFMDNSAYVTAAMLLHTWTADQATRN
jgi:hypothetical protein